MSFLDALTGNVAYPTPAQFNPANFQGIVGSPNYAALQGAEAQKGASAANALSALPGGGTPSSYGAYTGQQAQLQGTAAEEPISANDQLQQYDLQNAVAQNTFQGQNAANQANQAGMGQLLGTGLGAALGAWKQGGKNFTMPSVDTNVQMPQSQPNAYGVGLNTPSTYSPYGSFGNKANPYGVAL